jgi:ABC-type Fe3+ transport system permease subunit
LCFIALRAGVWAIFLIAFAWPSTALLVRCLTEGRAPEAGFSVSSRQLFLLGKSVGLAAVATSLCLLVSIPGAVVLSLGALESIPLGRKNMSALRGGHATQIHWDWFLGFRGAFWRAALLLLLVCPPFVYAFGWEPVWPRPLAGEARCVAVWSLWAWPIPALLLGAGWSTSGRAAFQAATLETSVVGAFLRVGVRSMLGPIAAAALIVFVLFLGDYGVPHAAGLVVYATELLGWASSSPSGIDVLWPTLPLIIINGAIMFLLWVTLRRGRGIGFGEGASTPSSASWPTEAATFLCFAVSWLIPGAILIWRLDSPKWLATAYTTYAYDLGWSFFTSALAGLMAMTLGATVPLLGRIAPALLVWALCFGVLPGAVVGSAMVAGFHHPVLSLIYDHWPILVLCYAARFGWIGLAVGLAAYRQIEREIHEQAYIDGAGIESRLVDVFWPLARTPILCVGCVVTALSLAEIAASSLVRVPSFTPLAHILMEKFHRFEDQMLAGLSLLTLLAALPAAFLVWVRGRQAA